MQGTLRAAECRFFIVEKSVVMVYNKLLNFAGVTGDPGKSGFRSLKMKTVVLLYETCCIYEIVITNYFNYIIIHLQVYTSIFLCIIITRLNY